MGVSGCSVVEGAAPAAEDGGSHFPPRRLTRTLGRVGEPHETAQQGVGVCGEGLGGLGQLRNHLRGVNVFPSLFFRNVAHDPRGRHGRRRGR